MTEELKEGPPQPTAPVEPGRGSTPAPVLPVSDELRRAVEDAQSAAIEPSTDPAPEVGSIASGPVLGALPEAVGPASRVSYIEPEASPRVPAAAPFEVTTRALDEWRIAVEPRSVVPNDTPIQRGLAESLPLHELRAVPLGSAAAVEPRRRLWRRDRAADRPEDPPVEVERPAFGEPLPPTAQARSKLTGRERRWVRRRRRVVFEEVLAWVLVPVILVACYWLLKSILAAMGTTPTAILEGVKAAIQGLERR